MIKISLIKNAAKILCSENENPNKSRNKFLSDGYFQKCASSDEENCFKQIKPSSEISILRTENSCYSRYGSLGCSLYVLQIPAAEQHCGIKD